MNRNNLIKLGALAQKIFDMSDGFEIRDISSDSSVTDHIVIPGLPVPVTKITDKVVALRDSERVTLQKFGDGVEFVRCGYSARANVLFIKEPYA